MVKLEKDFEDSVHITRMKDGDIAVVVYWHDNNFKEGDVVQRIGRDLITIGKGELAKWDKCFDNVIVRANDEHYRVRVLEHGEQLTVC